MADILIVVNPARSIKAINREALDLLGYKEPDLIGQGLDLILAEPASLLKATAWEGFQRERFISGLKTALRTSGGNSIPAIFSAVARHGQDEAVAEVICLFRDLRETLHLEAELSQSGKMVALGQLAGGIAHEINNPLARVYELCRQGGHFPVEKSPQYGDDLTGGL